MKKALQTRSPRAAGLALAIALGLAAASHSAQAAIVQITLGGADWTKTNSSTSESKNLLITGPNNTASGVDWVFKFHQVNASGAGLHMWAYEVRGSTGTYGYGVGYNGDAKTSFSDTRINSGAPTQAFVSFIGVTNSNVTLTRVVFNDAATTLDNNFTPSSTSYPEFGAASTAVPEPGTFIPAAVLVAGALLRRRRTRSHRSGRATA
jgi:uncharacterized protein (TIGR03382 family)